jgi:hypothetical protein
LTVASKVMTLPDRYLPPRGWTLSITVNARIERYVELLAANYGISKEDYVSALLTQSIEELARYRIQEEP